MVEIITMDHTQILVVMFIIVQSIGVMELIKLVITIITTKILPQIMLEVITQIQISHREIITQTQQVTLM